MVPTHPVKVDLAHEYAKDIPSRSGRHEKKTPGCPSVHKDTNVSDILLLSDDDSDRDSTV